MRRFVLTIFDLTNTAIYQLDSEATGGLPETLPAEGTIVCTTECIGITPGRCYINLDLTRSHLLADHISYAAYFDVEADDFYGTGKLPTREWAINVVKHRWTAQVEEMAGAGR